MEETGQEICRELRTKYGQDRVVFYRCDVTSEQDLVSIILTQQGGVPRFVL